MILHNTLTGRTEPFAPALPPQVRMYVCGLTVYGRGHIGNYRSLVATDLLRRTLRYKGWRVKEVMNITDVDDRIIQLGKASGKDLRGFTAEHIRSFDEDSATLRMERPEVVPRATDHIPDMIGLVERLITRGHTYTAEGSVYFKLATFPEYGRLSRLDVSGIKAGARVDTDKYEKEDARDFVLWKAKEDEPEWAHWDAPFGRGRPGWHLECSAMSMKYLGETFDLHCGGVDLIFPHHENEIAQSTCATGKPFVRHWMHVTHLLVDNETMSKSKGNFYTIPDLLERGHRPDAIRYLLCAAHYRKPLNFTWDGLHQAAASIDKVHGFVRRLDEIDQEGPPAPAVETAVAKAREAFDRALEDDLNTPEALAAVHELVNEGNRLLAEGALTGEGAARVRSRLEAMDQVFAVLLPGEDRLSPEEQALFDARQEARRKREFQKADEHRKKLEEMGVILEDTPKGTRWRRKH
ncbi:MAG: cysteine--tRNA ligase [Acidobacteria bacterium]|nr:MAG: cysteine--tRNA ligase [Acidobacteriota bacterium]